MDELSQAFAYAAARARRIRWRSASPLEWAMRGAATAGCYFAEARTLVDRAGRRRDLTQGTPAMRTVMCQALDAREQLRAAAASAAAAITRAEGRGGAPECRLLPPPTACAEDAAREVDSQGV